MTSPISYIPEPQERAYYEGLFQAADVKRTNNIGGGEAVQFFSRSKLPMEVLKNIWTVADQPSTSSLDRQKFAVAIRLIQLTQNGTKGQGANLATAPGVTLRPAFLEGVSGVTIPLPQPAAAAAGGGPPPAAPPQQQQQQQQQQQAPPSPNASIRSGLSSAIPPPPGSVASGYAPPSAAGGSVAPGPNNALVPQDPYSMTPQEQGRYEALFPQYAKPDGFVYGKEAVELFMKSGVDAQALREIWNLTDRPVDNRLDKVEFAICMHLIVCISKKNLVAPQGQLPPSLRALKAPQQQAQQQAPAPSMPPAAAAAGMAPPTPAQQPSLQPAGGMSISDAFEGMDAAPVPEPAPAPEPVPAPAPALPTYVPEPQQQQQQPAPPSPAAMPAPAMVAAGMAGMGMAAAAAPSMMMMEPPAPAPAAVETLPEPAAAAPAPSTQDYQMGDDSQELSKLKDVLQKLQAENISLKAQLGSMTEEEREVHKQLGSTVSEIGNLSQQLQGLRVQVSDAKSKLLEASAKLKAAQEQKGVLSDLITEANATKGAIEEATASIENATEASVQHQHMAAQQQQQMALQQNNNFESNLFGFENNAPAPPAAAGGLPEPSAMPAPGGMMAPAPPAAAQDGGGGLPAPDSFGAQSFDSGLPPQMEVPLASSTDASMLNQPASSPQGGLGGFPDMAPSASTDSGFPPQEVAPPAGGGGVNPFGDERSAVSAHSGPSAHSVHSPVPEQGGAVEMPPPAAVPAAAQPPPPQQYQQPPPPGGDPTMAMPTPTPPQQYQQPPPPAAAAGGDGMMPIPTPNAAQAYHQMPPPGQPVPQAIPTPQTQQGYMPQQQTPIATPNYGLARPSVDHNRKESVGGFGGDFVMGGFAPPPGAGGVYGAAAAATAAVETQAPQQDNSAAVAQLEELKKRYKGAQEIASDAAATHIKLAQEADELRGDADKAEANARSLRASADEKKKGRFGGSNKKKALNRDADNAAQTANDLRKRFLAVQGQASDASAVAMETKREAERLKEAVEKAEIDMASAASMQDQRVEQDKQAAAAAAAAPPAGYPQQQPYGYPPAAANGYPPAAYGQPPAGYGQPPPQYGAPPAGYGAPPPGQVPGYAYAQAPPPQVQAPQYQAPYEGDPGFPSSPY